MHALHSRPGPKCPFVGNMNPRSVFITRGGQLAMGFLGCVPYVGQLDGGMAPFPVTGTQPLLLPSCHCLDPHSPSGKLGQSVHACDTIFSA